MHVFIFFLYKLNNILFLYILAYISSIVYIQLHVCWHAQHASAHWHSQCTVATHDDVNVKYDNNFWEV